MYELVKVTDRFYYINSLSKIAMILTGNKVTLIDSGNNDSAGKRVLRTVEREGWEIEKILVTHAHSDHIGGNKVIVGKTGCPVYATPLEVGYVENPLLEPTMLYGAYPMRELCTSFLVADGVPCERLTEEALPDGVNMIDLYGHTMNMVGFSVDGVVYLADAVASSQTLEKYALSYVLDVKGYLETLDKIDTLVGDVFIGSHFGPTSDIKALTELNRRKIFEVRELIIRLCEEPIIFEDLLSLIFVNYRLNMTHEQYALVGSTLRSYLSWLSNEGVIGSKIIDNHLVFQRLAD